MMHLYLLFYNTLFFFHCAVFPILTKICNFITENIFFADLNNYSLEITKIRIKSILITLFSRDCNQIINRITFHSYLGNTLTNFGKDFPIKFHIIFGNPPYISSDNIKKSISKNTLSELKENYSSVIKKGSKPDLYFYFLKGFYSCSFCLL